jgi:HD superfamily phosphohydrolase
MFDGYPTLSAITKQLDSFLKDAHPDFFGDKATHPFLPIKPYKVIHDHLWGTNRFSWRELVLIDSPIFQRLRGIHQTGLAYHVYPSARHSRFEHSLGVATVAAKVFDALIQSQRPVLEKIASAVRPDVKPAETLAQLRAELRIAALLHDTGHSIHSHASERVYSELGILKKAVGELSSFVGKEKGSGEVISFCLAQTEAVAGLLKVAASKLTQADNEDFSGDIDLDNVSLMIVGRSKHPLLQFLGDIISSGFDADKLDYLLRDAAAAGLPLRYDLERYLYTAFLDKDVLADGEGELQKLYALAGATVTPNEPKPTVIAFKHFDTYRLRLPKMAMSTIEQIVICKLMLFSYIYHHQKVRAAEGMLIKLLEESVSRWQKNGMTDEAILQIFLSATDATLDGELFLKAKDADIAKYTYRLANRLIPREVYRLSPAFSHAEGRLIKDFFTLLEDREKRQEIMKELHKAIGMNLCKGNPALGNEATQALWNAGVWVDVPKVPKFEDMSVLVGGGSGTAGYPISDLFPISQWTQAYQSHRFYVRIYAFSESVDDVAKAAQAALSTITGIKDPEFYRTCLRSRT